MKQRYQKLCSATLMELSPHTNKGLKKAATTTSFNLIVKQGKNAS